jgi:cytochrome P450
VEASGPGLWILTRYRDVERMFRDPRFSAVRHHSPLVRRFVDGLAPPDADVNGGLGSLLSMDAPAHTRIRSLVAKAFTARRIAALRPRIEAIVSRLLEEVPRSGCFDLIESLAAPLPAIAIAELLGVPSEDHSLFKDWTRRLVDATRSGSPLLGRTTQLLVAMGNAPDALAGDREAAESRASVETAIAHLTDYLRRTISLRRKSPRDDLLSAMIEAQQERDALTDPELLATSNLILMAGQETTTNLIGNGVLALLRHPGELARLRQQPGLLPLAIEEMLRFESPVQGSARVPLENVRLDGETLPAGALAIGVIGAANRDPEIFPDPDRFDIGRSDDRHLAFGHGAHFCLGAALARLQAEVALRALLGSFPNLELAGDLVTWRPNFALRGLSELPLRVGSR